MKIKVTASVQQLRDISIPESEAKRLSGAIVDGARQGNSWTTPDLSNEYSSYVPWSLSPEFAVEVKPSPTLDLSKPVQTRDGRAVEIKYVDESLEWPINGIVTNFDGKRFSRCWHAEGNFYSTGTPHGLDLVQAPEPIQERWINIYGDSNGDYAACAPTLHISKESADKAAQSCGMHRYAVINVSLRKGEGL